MANRDRRKIDFEGMIQGGEHAGGLTSQTVNGTGHWKGTGWNKAGPYTSPELQPSATRPAGRSNRTSE
jgi:hypothetical protein